MIQFDLGPDKGWGRPKGKVHLELIPDGKGPAVWTYDGPVTNTFVNISEGTLNVPLDKFQGYMLKGEYDEPEEREMRLEDGQILTAQIQNFETFQPTQFK